MLLALASLGLSWVLLWALSVLWVYLLTLGLVLGCSVWTLVFFLHEGQCVRCLFWGSEHPSVCLPSRAVLEASCKQTLGSGCQRPHLYLLSAPADALDGNSEPRPQRKAHRSSGSARAKCPVSALMPSSQGGMVPTLTGAGSRAESHTVGEWQSETLHPAPQTPH